MKAVIKEKKGMDNIAYNDVPMPEIEDRIINDTTSTTTTYVVIAIPFLDYDIDTPVLMTCDLREVPNED